MMKSRQFGFTLVEILISLTLVSMLMLGLVISLRTFGEASAHAERRTDGNDARLILVRLLRGIVASADGRSLWGGGGEPAVAFFFGSGSELSWLGVMPARSGVGGEYFLRLSVTGGAAGDAVLKLQYAPFRGVGTLPEWEQAPVEDLLPDIVAMHFAYQAGDGLPWVPDWTQRAELPARVRIDIQARSGIWPSVVVPITQSDGGEASGGGK